MENKLDWKILQIQDIAQVIRGASPRPKGDKRYYGGNVPRLMVEDVTRDGKYVYPSVDFLTEEGAKLSRPCTAGTLTIVCSGTVGVPSILGVDACIHDGFLGLVKVSPEVSVDYLYHFFCTQREKFNNSATHGGVFTNLTTDGVKAFEVKLPVDLTEQEKIATALSDTDALISELEKLIEKKQAIKTATMQQLLTGKTRLPEFALREDGTSKGYKGSELGQIPEDWEIYRLSDVSLIDPENLNSSTSHDYQFEYISLENVDRGILLGTTTQIFSTSPSRARRVVRCGDILISTVRPNLMSHYYFNKAQRDVVCSTGFSLARPIESKLNGLFFYYHLFGKIINNQIDKIVIGSNYPAINSNDVRNFKLMVPSLKEQHSIVKIFEQLDAEIAQRTTQLKKLQFIKQGMMQELLTGKTRLV